MQACCAGDAQPIPSITVPDFPNLRRLDIPGLRDTPEEDGSNGPARPAIAFELLVDFARNSNVKKGD